MPTSPLPPPDAHWADLTARLMTLANALSRDPAEAEELVQETLLALLARCPDKSSHLGYARRTLTNRWLSRQRSLRRRMRRLFHWSRMRPTVAEPADQSTDPGQIRAVLAAIDSLPPRQRAVLALRLIDGLSYGQIAETTNSNVPAVRATLHVARAKVRSALGGTP